MSKTSLDADFQAGDTKDVSASLRAVGSLIDSGQLLEAQVQLDGSEGAPPELVELMKLKLAVAERRLEPSSALQSVIAFLRKDPRHPLAIGLYQEFSLQQYEAGHSCPSHSHPPPRSR